MTCESGLEGSSLVALIFVFSFIFRPPSSNCQWLYSLVKFYRCTGTFSGDHLLFFSGVSTRQWFNVTHDATFFLGTCLTRGSSGPAGGTIVHTERGGGCVVVVRDVSCNITKGGRCGDKTFQKMLDSIAICLRMSKAAQNNFSGNNESVILLSPPPQVHLLLVSQWTWISQLVITI